MYRGKLHSHSHTRPTNFGTMKFNIMTITIRVSAPRLGTSRKWWVHNGTNSLLGWAFVCTSILTQNRICMYSSYLLCFETCGTWWQVWSSTEFVGFGIASKNGQTFICANYLGAGNVSGRFDEHVKPLVSSLWLDDRTSTLYYAIHTYWVWFYFWSVEFVFFYIFAG